MIPEIIVSLPEAIEILSEVMNAVDDNKLKSKLNTVYLSMVAVNSTLYQVAKASADTFEYVRWY
jgi:hypothetical protein